MKRIFQLFFIGSLVLFSFKNAKAQQVISSAGSFCQNSSGALSYTLGEVVIDTWAIGNTTVTQGFQQPKIIVTVIRELSDLNFSIMAYPNPTADIVKLKAEKERPGSLEYTLYNLNGKLLLKGRLGNGESEISLQPFSMGTYLLKILLNSKEVKDFKIEKQ
jgi:hypothetical protein